MSPIADLPPTVGSPYHGIVSPPPSPPHRPTALPASPPRRAPSHHSRSPLMPSRAPAPSFPSFPFSSTPPPLAVAVVIPTPMLLPWARRERESRAMCGGAARLNLVRGSDGESTKRKISARRRTVDRRRGKSEQGQG